MSEEFYFKTPVLFIIFNRPETTMQVFERIRQARPPKLFIVADGARKDKPGEAEKCEQCRAIKDMVDWQCEVYTNFADENIGCKNRVASGISWVFEQVEEAIILEDDCLPNMSFFRFCQEMLEKYKNDPRVMIVSGSNHDNCEYFDESYAFSKTTMTWGWATWRRVWNLYDITMKLWPQFKDKGYLKNIFRKHDRLNLENSMQIVYQTGGNTWDWQLAFCMIANHGLDIIPKVNLVRNIGFGNNATHTFNPFDNERFYMDEEITFPLVHPQIMSPLNILMKPQNKTDEDRLAELKEAERQFRQLLQANQFQAVIFLFKDILRNKKFFHVNQLYYVAAAYFMLRDLEHAQVFVDILLEFNPQNAGALDIQSKIKAITSTPANRI